MALDDLSQHSGEAACKYNVQDYICLTPGLQDVAVT
jgi:hypothetical protein